MRVFCKKIFSGYLIGAASPSFIYTLPEFELLLGSVDSLFFEVVLADVTGSPTNFKMDTQWSNTGANWTTLNSSVISIGNPTSGNSEVGNASSEAGARVRVAMKLTGASSSANVALYACGRGFQNWLRMPNNLRLAGRVSQSAKTKAAL